MDAEMEETIKRLEDGGKTTMAVSYDGRFIGIIGLADAPRPDLKTTLGQLLDLGVQKLVMLTGDNDDVAQKIAQTVGLTDVRAELLPEQKLGGAGTAVALETADVALMADDLGQLPFAVGLSRASRSIIRQNLGIALGVTGLLIVTSVFGLVQLSGAVILHEGSTILVVLNALRLLRYKL